MPGPRQCWIRRSATTSYCLSTSRGTTSISGATGVARYSCSALREMPRGTLTLRGAILWMTVSSGPERQLRR